jgi:phosphoribosylformylglycinamidine synthase subunit PurSL
MVARIEVMYTIPDARAHVRKERLRKQFPAISDVFLADVYTVDMSLDDDDMKRGTQHDNIASMLTRGTHLDNIASMLTNSVTQSSDLAPHPLTLKKGAFDWAIEVGFLPGVTDNVGSTAREGVEDLMKKEFPDDDHVYTSQVTYLSGKDGNLSRKDVEKIASTLFNPVIERVNIKSALDYANRGMGLIVPKVKLLKGSNVDTVDILNASDDELINIGKYGILNSDGTRRGPLAADLISMKAVQSYFRSKDRNPRDTEVEMIFQSWSEHCKHPKFADPIDDITEGLFKRYIKGATERIRRELGEKDFCVSVFTDNAGAITFDENYLIAFKVETHNTPSALDPFGGAITGIVGVMRDLIGFGMGAKPFANVYGFCFGNPNDLTKLFRDKEFKQELLSRRAIQDGVIYGVNVGGNCSGIPTPQGFAYHNDRYAGKPLVYVGTAGIIPRTVNGKPSHIKKAMPGDYIVMTGGRVGKDGTHGATFSSEALTAGSPSTAVQIGDPITQKKMSDAIIKEARDLGLYHSITDNGAGGLSSSVGEMSHESGGCYVEIDKVPLKYPGMDPWEIWVSESQERMTLSVPKDKWNQFYDLMYRRGVEATVIGEFTSSGKCVIDDKNKTILDLDLDFLQNGLPQKHMVTQHSYEKNREPSIPVLEDLTESLHSMLSRMNIASKEYISEQFDHEVQGGSVLKPLQGRGRVNGDATILRPVLTSNKGVVFSHALNPSYSDISAYDMAAAAIDTAVRNAACVGVNLEHLALLDNFCWASPDDPKNMGKLKEACNACYDLAVAYKTPFISGKDSMYNDFKGFDADGNPLKISVPLTLLISSFGVIDDVSKAVSMDAKIAGDKVYVLGSTFDELGGSEYYAMMGEKLEGKPYIGIRVPVTDPANLRTYKALSKCIDEKIVASATSVNIGGLGVALARTSMAGMLGMDIDLNKVPATCIQADKILYSQSGGRVIVTVAPENQQRFEDIMHEGNEISFANIGTINDTGRFNVKNRSIIDNSKSFIDTTIDNLLKSYRSTFEGF